MEFSFMILNDTGDGITATGSGTAIKFRRETDKTFYDWGDTSFTNSPVTLNSTMSEVDSHFAAGLYVASLDVSTWTDGEYAVISKHDTSPKRNGFGTFKLEGGVEIHDNITDRISSMNTTVNAIQDGLTTTVIELANEPEGTPRIEAGDTHQFIKNIFNSPNSVAVSITAPDSTTIASLQTASQSGTSNAWFFHYVDQNSWHTTVESSGQFIIEWTIFRATGNDSEKQYFEVIKTD